MVYREWKRGRERVGREVGREGGRRGWRGEEKRERRIEFFIRDPRASGRLLLPPHL